MQYSLALVLPEPVALERVRPRGQRSKRPPSLARETNHRFLLGQHLSRGDAAPPLALSLEKRARSELGGNTFWRGDAARILESPSRERALGHYCAAFEAVIDRT